MVAPIAGASSAAVRSKAALYKPQCRLPEMPMIVVTVVPP
jgi:hypothetical protein